MADGQHRRLPDHDSDPREDLAYIRYVMQESQRSTTISGPLLVIWGSLDCMGYIAQWWMERHDVVNSAIAMMWGVALIVGCLLAYRRGLQQTALSPTGRMVLTLWISSWVTISLVYFAGSAKGLFSKGAFPGVEAAIIAVPVFTTGLIARVAWLRNLGVVWWAASALMLTRPGTYTDLMIAGLYFALFVVPGALLMTQTRHQPAIP